MEQVEIETARNVIVGSLTVAQAQVAQAMALLEADEVDWRSLAESLYIMRVQSVRAGGAANRVRRQRLLEECGVVGKRE